MLAAAGLASDVSAEEEVEASAPPSWDVVRRQFRLAPGWTHLGGLLLASHPAAVRRAIEAHRRGLDANPVQYLHGRGPQLEAAVLREAGAYLGASPSDIALTDSTTMGLGLLYNGIDLRAGQEALTSRHDFFATHEALRLKAAHAGASVREISLYDRPEAAAADRIVAAVASAVRPSTRVVALGPRGTGIVWGRPDAWPAVAHTIPTFSGTGTPGRTNTPGGFHSFEHRWALAPAFALHRQIGKARIAARVHALAGRLKSGLAELPHVRLHTPRAQDLSAGIVCFDVDGLSPGAVVDRLQARRIVATVTPYTPSHARLAPGLLNTPADVDRALAALRSLR